MRRVEIRCPSGHLIVAVTLEGKVEFSTVELVANMDAALLEGRFGTACACCGAKRETWTLRGDP